MATIDRNDGTRKSSPRTLLITSNHAEISLEEGVAPTLTEPERWLGTLKTGSACGSTLAPDGPNGNGNGRFVPFALSRSV